MWACSPRARPGLVWLLPLVALVWVPPVMAQPTSDPSTGLAAGRTDVASGWFNLPVPGGQATLTALGIRDDERALTLAVVARAFHAVEVRSPTGAERLARLLAELTAPSLGGTEPSDPVHIPVPLTAEAWRGLLDLPPQDDLFAALVTDRAAILLASSLTATHASIRALVAGDRDLRRFLYREGFAPFTIAARSLRVDGGRVGTPGGAGADAIWETLAGVSPARPVPFLTALLTRDGGRLAWYYDTIAGLEEARLPVVWPDLPPAGRLAEAQALYEAFQRADPHWRIPVQPLRRIGADAWTVVALTDIGDGAIAAPAARWLWSALFGDERLDRRKAERLSREERAPVSMAWLAREIVLAPMRERRDRFEMFRLAQRVFRTSTDEDAIDVAVALAGYRRYRALLLALERMGVVDPAIWAAAVEAARHVDVMAGSRTDATAAFQGALALTERARHARSLDAATAGRLVQSLSAAIRADGGVTPAIGQWIADVFVRALPPLVRPDSWTGRTAYESTIIQGLAGPPPDETVVLEWEGLTYRVDYQASEHARIAGLRRLLDSPGLDEAIATGSDRDLARALVALVYAAALGDRDGPAGLSLDVPSRHEFGLHSTALLQMIVPWAPPEERAGDGRPWRVVGSLVGLDLGLSRLALRRLGDEELPMAPTLTLNDFAGLTRTVASFVPSELTDGDRDEMAAAIARGHQRLQAAALDPDSLVDLAMEARLSADVRELLPWVAQHQPSAVSGFFALRDLLWLGAPAVPRERLDWWGMHGGGLDGRQRLTMPPPMPWELFSGRADLGQMTTQVPDLTLRLVEVTAELRLPASLVPALLALAAQDYWHDVQARFADDWPRMVRQAAALSVERIEDYVAALTGDGPLRPE